MNTVYITDFSSQRLWYKYKFYYKILSSSISGTCESVWYMLSLGFSITVRYLATLWLGKLIRRKKNKASLRKCTVISIFIYAIVGLKNHKAGIEEFNV